MCDGPATSASSLSRRQLRHLLRRTTLPPRIRRRQRADRIRWLVALSLPIVGPLTLVATLGLYAVLFAPMCWGGQSDTARNQAFELAKSIELYKLQAGVYPEDFRMLVDPQVGRPLMEKVPNDPWGQPYLLVVPGRRNPLAVDVVSAGPDGLMYSEDDMGNWDDS